MDWVLVWSFFPKNVKVLFVLNESEPMFLQTLESGIVVGQGLKVVPRKCVTNNKRKAWNIWQTVLSKGKLQNSINAMQCVLFKSFFGGRNEV